MNMQITQLILLKAITNLPFSDFVLCKYLLLPNQMRDDTIKEIIYIADLLEQCDFVLFWQHVQNKTDLFEKITGFYVSEFFMPRINNIKGIFILGFCSKIRVSCSGNNLSNHREKLPFSTTWKH